MLVRLASAVLGVLLVGAPIISGAVCHNAEARGHATADADGGARQGRGLRVLTNGAAALSVHAENGAGAVSTADLPTRTAAVMRQLRHEIVTGRMPPGTVIKDAELAERMHVSMTQVREAIAQLAALKLIETAPNRTRRVAGVTRDGALELIDVLGVLACAGFAWGMVNLTDTHLEQLKQRQRTLEDAAAAGEVITAGLAVVDFSAIIVRAGGNAELQAMLDVLTAWTLRIFAVMSDSDLWQVWVDGQDAVLTLLQAGDHRAALERYRQIYQQCRTRIEKGVVGAL